MPYRAEKRVVLGRTDDTGAVLVYPDVVIHEDRGDGTALCAVGSQMGTSKPFLPGQEWRALGPGEVTCELCAKHQGGRGSSASPSRPKRAPADSTARPLSERTGRRNRGLLGDLPWRHK